MTLAARKPARLAKAATSGKLLAAALILALVPAPELLAQASVAVQAAGAPLMLHINILEGEEALNNIKERTAREPIIQVEDQNHKPVAGALIIFTSVRGTNGAGGTFNSFTQYRTVTNAEGKAIGHGFQPNTTAGQFTVQVTASVGGTVAATAVIHETNSLAAVSGSSSSLGASQTATTNAQTATNVGTTAGSKGGLFHVFNAIPKWAVVGVVSTAVAAAAVAVVVTQNSNGTNISTGTGTVGAPSLINATARR